MKNLTQTDIKKLSEAYESLKALEKLLDARIMENNRVREALVQQATHCYMFYREKCWQAMFNIGDILEKFK